VDVIVKGQKNVTGGTLTAGQFSFGIYDSCSDVTPIATATNDAAGVITFPAESFTTAGTYTRYLKETSTSGSGWSTDTGCNPVTITVTDNGLGALTATVTTPKAFMNNYSVTSTTATLTATKTANGKS
jgi:pilin isopeptide linkage protein